MIDRTTIRVIGLIIFCGYATAWADDEPTSEDIEPQPLNEALREFADRSGLQMVYRTELAAGIKTGGTDAPADEREALDQLLASTGLAYRFINDRTISIQAVDAEVARDPGNAATTPGPTLIAQASGNQVRTSPVSSRTDGVSSIVSGKVTDARTRANLKGALVTVEELGLSTSTDDLGRYQFPAVQPGDYTIRVSYLGYGEQSIAISVRDGNPVAEDFVLTGGSELEEIVVFGQRSARALALNQERTALNSTTVLSADALGQFNGTTISEALRRAPGVAFVPDPTTGDGAQVIVRGLEPDLNQVTLNGVRLLDGTGLGRSPDLSGILTESIESVTINKSLLPSQDSNGAGALIEIETKSPLDRDARFASFGVEYGETGGDFGDEFGVNGTVSRIFGAGDDFGISLSGSYREREVTRISYDQGTGGARIEVLPLLNVAGEPIESQFDMSPLRRFPFEPQFNRVYPGAYTANQGSSDQETLSIVTAVQKHVGEHTDLKFDAVFTQDETLTYNVSTQVSSATGYDLAPVDALGGELREVLVAEDLGRNDPNPITSLIFGDGLPGFVRRDASYIPDQKATSLSLRISGNTTSDDWTFEYTAGYVESKNEQDKRYGLTLGTQSAGATGFFDALIDRELLSEEALANTTGDGRIISVYPAFESGADGRFILPLFNEEGFAFYNSVDTFPVDLKVVGPRESTGEEASLFGSARRNFGSRPIEYVEVGVDYRETSFVSPGDIGSGVLGDVDFENASDVLSSDLGLVFGPGILSRVGADNDFDSLARGSLESLISNIDAFQADGLLILADDAPPVIDEFRKTDEDTLAVYLEGGISFENLEIVGGVRLERIEVGSTFYAGPRVVGVDGQTIISAADFGQLVSDEVSQTNILPRVLANYRFSENVLLRGAYYVTVSRPQLSNLTARQRLTLRLDPARSSTGDRPVLSIRQGNPDLEPATTHSFDLSFEWYSDNIGVLKAAAFYKIIENPLQSNKEVGDLALLPEDLVLPDAPFFDDLPDPIELIVTQPVNGEDDNKIWGFESTIERQLTFLPGLWEGFGVYANYTYTDSKSTQRLDVNTSLDPRGFVEFNDVPFEGWPKHQGTFGVTYNKYNVDASLYYTEQDRRLSSIGRFGLDVYEESIETLDLRVEYLMDLGNTTMRLFLRGEDLLSSKDDAYLQTSIGGEAGVPRYYTGGTYFGGRSFFGGVSVVF